MKIDYEGRVYDLDLANFTLKQAMAIQGYTGMPVMKLFEQFKDIEEDTPELLMAIGAIFWLMKNQAGEVFPIADSDPPLVPFLKAFVPALMAEVPDAEPGAEPVPTVPSRPASPSPRVSRSRKTNREVSGQRIAS